MKILERGLSSKEPMSRSTSISVQAKSGFENKLRLKLREYIMLSEPVYRDHFSLGPVRE